jgi:hypothetical protein
MLRISKSIFAATAVAATLLAVGCQTTPAQPQPSTAAAATTQPVMAVVCTKCEITWVKVPQTQKGRIVGYSTKQAMECPDCRTAVENFFATGKLEHTCKSCGETMQTCEMH